MRNFPFHRQMDAMDCGPTCLQMICEYYGKKQSLESLRKSCYAGKEGVSLMSISSSAEQFGFKTFGGRFTFEDLYKSGSLPCIVSWDQNHFIVVFKIKGSNNKTKISVADPRSGLKIYNKAEFLSHWINHRVDNKDVGIALLFEPTQSFFQQKEEKINKNAFHFIIEYVSKYRRFFFQLFTGLFVGSILQLVFPFLTQATVDIGISNKDIGIIYLILLSQLMLFFGKMSIDFTRRWILLHISTRISISLISDFFIKLMKLPMSFFETKLLGDSLQRIEDHRRIEKFLTEQALNILFYSFNFFVFGIVLFIYSKAIIGIFLIGCLLYFFWSIIFLKKRRQIDFKRFEQNSLNQSKTIQLISGMQEIKLQNCERRKRWEWEDIQTDLYEVNIAALRLEQYQESGSIFINETKNIIITIIAATSVIKGSITLGMMLSIQFMIGQLSPLLVQFVRFIYNLQDTRLSLERINDIHQKQDEDFDIPLSSDSFISDQDSIYLKNVIFQYNGPYSPRVLDNISFKIPAGKITAIIGTSGSGKTTLIKLLLKYYFPVEGEIHLGDKELNNISSKWWRKYCGVVMQDGFIFSESIARNIASSDDDIDNDNMLNAAKIANIHEFIMSLPLKYNTIIGPDGQSISQGQKQRILIARAIYRNPQFLFFDEATNSLDANNEKVIVENLQKYYAGRTVIIVAHRLSTVKNADQIIVLEKGKVIEIGNHEELSIKKGAYYNLVKNQLELGN